jgi:hypothetical protein
MTLKASGDAAPRFHAPRSAPPVGRPCVALLDRFDSGRSGPILC